MPIIRRKLLPTSFEINILMLRKYVGQGEMEIISPLEYPTHSKLMSIRLLHLHKDGCDFYRDFTQLI